MNSNDSALRLKQIEQISKFLEKCERNILENDKKKGGESSRPTTAKLIRQMTY